MGCRLMSLILVVFLQCSVAEYPEDLQSSLDLDFDDDNLKEPDSRGKSSLAEMQKRIEENAHNRYTAKRHKNKQRKKTVTVDDIQALRMSPKKPNLNNPPPEMDEQEMGKMKVGKKMITKLKAVYDLIRPLRGTVGNVAASVWGLADPDSCLSKLLFILYRFDNEDDYPYLPRGCGDGFNWETGPIADGGF